MLFDEPVPFAEAVAYEQAKRLLPTTASSAELREFIPAEIRARGRFSAAVDDLDILTFIDSRIKRAVSPETVIDPHTGGTRPARPGEYMDAATFRVEMTKLLRSVGYQPEDGAEGTLRDLFSERRQDTIFHTNVRMAQEYGNYVQGQSEAVLDLWPCQELYREESREKPRVGSSGATESSYWGEIWVSKGGTLYAGRMIARKDDPIWTAISYFGLPYPPFHFQSGMGVRDIRRDEAVALGAIADDVRIQPDVRGVNDEVSATFDPQTPAPIVQELFNAFDSGIFTHKGRLFLQPQPEIEIRRIVDAVKVDPNHQIGRVFARVTDEAARRIASSSGVDVSGMKHEVDVVHMQHAFNEHPDLTEQDVELIPRVVAEASTIEGGTADSKNPRIKYIAEINGRRYHYVEEKLPGKLNRLQMVTFFRE